jgi:hypothetical protein
MCCTKSKKIITTITHEGSKKGIKAASAHCEGKTILSNTGQHNSRIIYPSLAHTLSFELSPNSNSKMLFNTQVAVAALLASRYGF